MANPLAWIPFHGDKREIWRQTEWRELGTAQDQCFYVDGGVRIAAAGGQTSFSGLTHLAGQAVAVLANGGVVKGLTVAGDGTLTLPASAVPPFAYTVIVGLAFTAQAITLRPEDRTAKGTMQGLLQRVHGGALPVSSAIASFAERNQLESGAKRAIAKAAAALIAPGQVVIIDGGTTSAELVRQLPLSLNATIVTHSPSVAMHSTSDRTERAVKTRRRRMARLR